MNIIVDLSFVFAFIFFAKKEKPYCTRLSVCCVKILRLKVKTFYLEIKFDESYLAKPIKPKCA